MAHPRTAIVADDDEFFRFALVSILENSLGFRRTVEVASYDEALLRMSALDRPVDLALFDLSMPGMRGPSTLAAVRERFPAARVAVVSGSSRREDILAALGAGVHGYVTKGLGVDELKRSVERIMGGDIAVPASLAVVPDPVPGHPERAEPSRNPPGAPSALPDALPPRQSDVLDLLVQGRSNKEIARLLRLGEGTVKIHVAALLRNLGVSNRAAAAVAGSRRLAPGSAAGARTGPAAVGAMPGH